ncbi:MAG: NAD(+)/NADH kinase [Coriobacteriia bacterium]|nr:NAD(+)/NADH kinase [Coriobacteriia bacterium]MCL2871115.1 NAD(+)/NADH kinase [Coriobacteriia bacterium]
MSLTHKKITLVVNDYDERALVAADYLRKWCTGKGIVFHQDDEKAQANLATDLVVALGGDGTIIRAVHKFLHSETPILGVKFGRLGFLSGAHSDELIEAVDATLQGRTEIEKRALLQVTAWSKDAQLGTYYALNEAVLNRHTDSPVVSTRLSINGHTVYQLRGDGIIVSTATGSTAYALSAGGPILSPESDAMALVPLASHTLINRSIVTAPKDLVRVDLSNSDYAGATLSIDGKVAIDNVYLERSSPSVGQALTHIELRIAEDYWVPLVKTSTRLFFDTLATEFYRHEDLD